MKIALVFIRHFSEGDNTEFTDTTGFISIMLQAFKAHQCTLITNDAQANFSGADSVYTLPEKHILPWNREVQIKSILQKTAPQLIIHFNKAQVILKHTTNILLFTSIGVPFEKYTSGKKFINTASKFNNIICFFKSQQEHLLKYQIPAILLPPIINTNSRFSINEPSEEKILPEYGIRPGCFLYLTYHPEYEETVDILKAFAQFKKRQKTNRQLVICSSNPFLKDLDKKISSYKYRADVIILPYNITSTTVHSIIKESYAIISLNNNRSSFQAILTAMANKISVITLYNNIAADVLGENAIYITNTSADLADAMMLTYKDENLRKAKIEAAAQHLNSFSEKNTMTELQAIIKNTPADI